MNLLNLIDDLGIYLLCKPLSVFHHLSFLNLIDDLGVSLVIRPLGKLDDVLPDLTAEGRETRRRKRRRRARIEAASTDRRSRRPTYRTRSTDTRSRAGTQRRHRSVSRRPHASRTHRSASRHSSTPKSSRGRALAAKFRSVASRVRAKVVTFPKHSWTLPKFSVPKFQLPQFAWTTDAASTVAVVKKYKRPKARRDSWEDWDRKEWYEFDWAKLGLGDLTEKRRQSKAAQKEDHDNDSIDTWER